MKAYVLISLCILPWVQACSDSYGHQVRGGAFTVFFTEADDEEEAVKIARYWKEHGFLTGRKQDIQLLSSGKNYTLRIIAREPEELDAVPFEEQKLLYGLRDSLLILFCDTCNLSIELCNGTFKPLYRID